jgi:catechol 2,3-dioxygenase-like lactoylglutathione lyase family enzyme
MLRQLAHVCFFTDHVDQLIHFYRDLLGLPIKFTLDNDAGQVMGYYFDCGSTTYIEIFDQTLAIKQWGGEIQSLIAAQGTQYRHFCLEVIGLEAFKQLLESRGVEVTPIKLGIDHSRQAWINDPDGNAIELMEYTDRSMQLSPAKPMP